MAVAGLLVLAVLSYLVQYLIFHNPREMWVWIINSFAFVPLDIILTAFIVSRVITTQEKRAQQQKLNMVIGAFFSQLGNRLLADLAPAAADAPETRQRLNLQSSWRKDDFADAARFALTLKSRVNLDLLDLSALRELLANHREFMVRLLENPLLLEHVAFTDLLWAVFHLSDELEAREDLANLPAADRGHLAGDVNRAFGRIVAIWVGYAQHLQQDYPYLFSLVLRTHPFQESPSPLATD